jgi:hypothetical protein
MHFLIKRVTLVRLLFGLYACAYLWLVSRHIGLLSDEALIRVFGNALIICLFVGLGININAFMLRNRDGSIRTLRERIIYIRSHLSNVLTFFLVPFCVSSASSIVLAAGGESLVQALFGTDSYLLIMLCGFSVFVALPTAAIYWRHGWDDSNKGALGEGEFFNSDEPSTDSEPITNNDPGKRN